MDVDMMRSILGWCAVMNIGLLIWWFLFFWLAHDWMYRFHSKLFRVSVETFDAIHYGGMAVYKIGIFLFHLVPYVALATV